MKHLPKLARNFAFIFLLPICHANAQNTQTGYTKVVRHIPVTHTDGLSILDDQGIRYGGFTNANPEPGADQYSHVVDYYASTRNCSSPGGNYWVRLDEKRVNGTYDDCTAYVVNFPYPGPCDQLTGFIPCNMILTSQYNDFLTNNYHHSHDEGPDLDLTMEKLGMDATVQASHLYGTTWSEGNTYDAIPGENCISPCQDEGYFVGDSRTAVYGGPTKITVAKIHDDQTLSWMKEVQFGATHPARFKQVLGTNNDGALVSYRTGSLPGGLVQLSSTGAVEWAHEYYLASYPAGYPWLHIGDMLQDHNDPASNVFCAMYGIVGANADIPMVFTEFSAILGTPSGPQKYYSLPGFQLFPQKIKKKVWGDGYWVVGELRPSANPADSKIFVMSIYADKTLHWAKSFEIGTTSFAMDMVEASDGGLFIVGNTNLHATVSDPEQRDYFMIKTKLNGNFQKGHTYKLGSNEYARTLMRPATGRNILAGNFYTSQGGGGNVDTHASLFVETDLDGIALMCNSIPLNLVHTDLTISTNIAEIDFNKPIATTTDVSAQRRNVQMITTHDGCEDCHCEQ